MSNSGTRTSDIQETATLILGALFLLLSLFCRPAAAADPLDVWHVRSFLSTSDLSAVTYANGVYVAVGNKGTLATSRDQVTWTTQALVSDTGVAEPGLNAVTYGGGLFVAVGTYIWTSKDGAQWTLRNSTAGPYGGVAYGNGRFVAAGGKIRIYTGASPVDCTNGATGCGVATSEDGITWTDRSNTSGLTTEPTVGLVFANGKFVQLGWHQPPYYSTDGLTWRPAYSATASLYNHGAGLAYGNGVFVAVGNYLDLSYGGTVMTSNDGISWGRTTGPAFRDICFGNGMFMATGSDTDTPPPYATYTSTNGTTWRTYANNTAGNAIAASPGSFTLVGGSMSIATTTDGAGWTPQAAGIYPEATAVSYGNGMFITVGTGGKIYTSPDAANWTRRSDPSLAGINFNSVAYGTNGWVAAGTSAGSGTPSLATSGDGVNWKQAPQSGPTRALAFGNGQYIGVAAATVYSSPDGVSWTPRASDASGALNGATFGNGKFMVVGDKTIMTSADGTTWKSASSGVGYRLVGVAAGNNLFAAAGDNGRILVSADGLSWSDAPSNITGATSAIAYGAGRFLAVGGQGSISYSSDGRTWTSGTLGYAASPWAIAYGNLTFVAVSGNTILQSSGLRAFEEPAPPPAPTPPAPTPPDPPPPDPPPAPASSEGGGGGGGGCFIASAAYGSCLHPFVSILRAFRDTILLPSSPGRSFVQWYWRVSPPVAAFIAGHAVLRAAVRTALLPVIGLAWLSLHAGIMPVLLLLSFLGVVVFVAARRGLRRKWHSSRA